MRVMARVRTHMRRSPYQALAAILTMFLTFLVSGVFFLATVASVEILRYFEGKPQITVFFQEKAGEKEATELKKTLEGTGKVASTRFVSKEEALAIYREQNKDDPLLLEMVSAEILPASLEVSATDPKHLKELVSIIQGRGGVDEVVYQHDVVESLLTWTNATRLIGGALASLLAVDSLLIIMTVIAMKIALKREEIDILKLVGASPWYIRWPFVLEGGLYGVLGAFLAGGVIAGILVWLRPFLLSFLGSIPTIHSLLSSPTSAVFVGSLSGFVAGLVVLGFLLGGLGSLVATARYVKYQST